MNDSVNTVFHETCFACGTENVHGLQMEFQDGPNGCTCDVTIPMHFQSYDGVVHGGIVATMLDAAMVHSLRGHDGHAPVTCMPVVDAALCTLCGTCSALCEFHAIATLQTEVMILEKLCHACGVCSYFCPSHAITETEIPHGVIRIGHTPIDATAFIDGILNVCEMSASQLISAVRKEALPGRVSIIDAPPGTSCSMVAAVNDTNAVSRIANPAEHAEHGAGPDAAQLMIREHIDMVLTGAVGTNAEVVLKKGGIQFTTGLNGAMTVREAISTFLNPKSN